MARIYLHLMTASLLAPSFTSLAQAQEAEEPRRTRIGLGVQVGPRFPGANDVSLSPMIEVSRAKSREEFDFEAPDESFDVAVLKSGNLIAGPAINLEGSRKADDVGPSLPKVGFTIEVGAFAQYSLSETLRLRSEVRKGVGGHDGWIANLGADFVKRDGDKWLFSVGPRVTISSSKYQKAYFGISPSASLSSGLPIYDADGGLMAVGVASGYLRQLSPRWGISTYAKYDRLVADAAKSPIVRELGSRNQLHGGLGLTYTFGQTVTE